jgi:hypothetical protein
MSIIVKINDWGDKDDEQIQSVLSLLIYICMRKDGDETRSRPPSRLSSFMSNPKGQ